MKTTMNIPSELLDTAIEEAGTRTKTETVILALEEFVRRKRLEKILRKAGTLKFASNAELENWRHG